MPDIISLDFSRILSEEGNKTINGIAASIIKNGQNASGKTIQNLHEEVSPNELIIWGNEYIEKGTPPNSGLVFNTIYLWSQYKQMQFDSNKNRMWFSKRAAYKINEEGSLLFQKGGRKDVYSDKVQPLIERISERLGKEIVNIKLIE